MKSRWWEEKARELQEAADRRDMKAFYTGLRNPMAQNHEDWFNYGILMGPQSYRRRIKSWRDFPTILTSC